MFPRVINILLIASSYHIVIHITTTRATTSTMDRKITQGANPRWRHTVMRTIYIILNVYEIRQDKFMAHVLYVRL